MNPSLAKMGLISMLLGLLGGGPAKAAPGTSTAALTAPPDISSESEAGFHDLLFLLEKREALAGGAQALVATGIHKGKKVSLRLVLGSDWKKGTLGDDITTYQGIVTYQSTGPVSDALLAALDDLYGSNVNPARMNKETRFTCISLGGDPRDLTRGPVHLKLFFESTVEDEYAEIYTNIDVKGRRVEIREKDESYREQVVRALSERPAR